LWIVEPVIVDRLALVVGEDNDDLALCLSTVYCFEKFARFDDVPLSIVPVERLELSLYGV
jgi:hypothetical protein